MIEKSTASHATQFSAFNLLTAWEQPICGDVATPLSMREQFTLLANMITSSHWILVPSVTVG